MPVLMAHSQVQLHLCSLIFRISVLAKSVLITFFMPPGSDGHGTGAEDLTAFNASVKNRQYQLVLLTAKGLFAFDNTFKFEDGHFYSAKRHPDGVFPLIVKD